MAASNALTPQDAPTQKINIVLSATGYPGGGILDTAEPRKIVTFGVDLTEYGPSAQPDYSDLTVMERFLTDSGIGRMERLIQASVLVEPPATTKRAEKRKSKRKKASSTVVEVGSACLLDTGSIMKGFGEN